MKKRRKIKTGRVHSRVRCNLFGTLPRSAVGRLHEIESRVVGGLRQPEVSGSVVNVMQVARLPFNLHLLHARRVVDDSVLVPLLIRLAHEDPHLLALLELHALVTVLAVSVLDYLWVEVAVVVVTLRK